jgi:hypothetical protein
MNESFSPGEFPLKLVNASRVLGGANTLKPSDVRSRMKVAESLQGWWGAATARDGRAPVLMDVETGDTVDALPGQPETYGPVYIPYHDFRVFLAQHEEAK